MPKAHFLSAASKFFLGALPWVLALAWSAAGATASDASTEMQKVRWVLRDTTSLNGVPLEVWGAPKVASEGGVHFNGKNDALVVSAVPFAGWREFTIQALFAADPDGPHEQRFAHFEDKEGHRCLLEIRVTPDGQWYLDTFLYADKSRRLTLIEPSKLHACGTFHWVALTFANGRMTHYVDGVKEAEGQVNFTPLSSANRTSLGARQNRVSWFKGTLRELRFDPRALSPEALERTR